MAQLGAINDTESGYIIVAIDLTGMKVTNRRDWMREKWKKRRGWVKVHIIVDVNTKELLGFVVTDERVGDSKEFKDLIERMHRALEGFFSAVKRIATSVEGMIQEVHKLCNIQFHVK